MDCAAVFMLVGWAAKSGDASSSVEAKQMSVFIRLGRQGIDGSTSHQNSSVQPLIEVFAHELFIGEMRVIAIHAVDFCGLAG